ncbi:MAG: hypothetical protein M3P95_12815 [Actinomycetota bacterium]|nr:hypothetical protein [Actinomycetota bacterium]
MSVAARGRPTRQTVFLALAFALLVTSVLVGAVAQLVYGTDERQVVVDLALGHDPERREALRSECGRLPGVTLVADRGKAAQASRFPARFSISGATVQQEQALFTCIGQYDDIVMGARREGQA